MLHAETPTRTIRAWEVYKPDRKNPWNMARVVHLHRRAGLAASWGELRRDLADGPEKSIARMLEGKQSASGEVADTANLLGDSATSSSEPGRLKAWWIYRMLLGPDPLTERLTLGWHNHFATSNDKIRNVVAMKRQNELFRKHARGAFGELLGAVLKDPAILIWLDAQLNRKGQPNENLAREIMELFTLGIGHYSEKDVKEAARALTGWTVADDAFREDASQHDAGEKSILGKTGKWKGDDLVKMLLAHPATARRLAGRLCEQFFGEKGVGDRALTELTEGLRNRNLDLGWGIETILRSQAFFADENLRNQVVPPVPFVVGVARSLEVADNPPSTLLMADWAGRLGQDLFYPPNVGGWPGGRRWISTQSLLGRANYVADLVQGRLRRDREPMDLLGLARRHDRARDLTDLARFFAELTFGTIPDDKWADRMLAGLGRGTSLNAETARKIAARTLSSPQASVS
jgi:uncharacterized protein (DUF1800 family)